MAGKLLIVDDVATNRIVFKVKLGAAFYTPLLAATGAECLTVARAEQPDLILLDLMLPDMSGTDVLRALRADAVTRDIPVIVLSSSHDDIARMAALAAGADDFLTKPFADEVLLARVRNLLRAHSPIDGLASTESRLAMPGMADADTPYEGPGVVALISDRPEVAMRWRKDLGTAFSAHYVVLTREEALSDSAVPHLGDTTPDIFLIDGNLGGGAGGLRLMSDLRSRGSSRFAAICLLGAALGDDRVAMAFDLGANDVIGPSTQPREVGLRLRTILRRKRAADRARASVQDGLRLAVIDPLTGLYNRRYAIPQLGIVAERAADDGTVFAVMVVDLDRFKSVNDRFGHAAGDAVLVEISSRLSTNLRATDLLARIGGEEFLIVLPNTTYAEAQLAAERLCNVVKDRPVMLPGGPSLGITVSIGVAFSGTHTASPSESVAAIIDRADQALLIAKSEGRNQVTISRTAA
jgi:two-component system, cell cycle response regulator